MSAEQQARVTEIVLRAASGEVPSEASSAELMPLVYPELRRLAYHYLQRERPDHTLQPTALVHEAFLKLVDQTRVQWKGRSHFFAVGAQAMRRLLVDHARGAGRAKRGGEARRVTLGAAAAVMDREDLAPAELLALHEALEKLAELDARQARIVELRFFSGLKVAEIASLLGISARTVEGDWTHARAWLRRELSS